MASIWARYLAELLGTYILVIVVACLDIVGEASDIFSAQAHFSQAFALFCSCPACFQLDEEVLSEQQNGSAAMAHKAESAAAGESVPLYAAGAVTALTYSLYNVSGAHLNPAVSVAFGVAGEMTWKMVGIYVALQSLAAMLGTFTFAVAFQVTLQNNKSGEYDWARAGLTEVLFSTMFCFVFLNVVRAKKNKDSQHYGLAIGLALLAATCAGRWSAADLSQTAPACDPRA
ncbi:unnamed protein product [Prorocentrum cordatum]|uniref:Aquaporin n=1 Tax=Prorocentrum cordatum TaxID=2364126 RepID=A0ABN9TT47_9DINO|nr:unnamed protein product [Polarella glacialis]